jgi:hypothetical protein
MTKVGYIRLHLGIYFFGCYKYTSLCVYYFLCIYAFAIFVHNYATRALQLSFSKQYYVLPPASDFKKKSVLTKAVQEFLRTGTEHRGANIKQTSWTKEWSLG